MMGSDIGGQTAGEGRDIRRGGAGLPPVSLIICSRDRPGLLRDTVASVLAGDAVPAELVVVDQSAAPHPELGAVGEERGCIVRYLWTPGARGLSRARNAGIAAARHDLLAIIDDDMFVAPAWFGALVGALLSDAGRGAVVTGRVLPAATGTPGGFVPALVVDESPAAYTGRIWKDVLAGGHMIAQRATLAAVGGFDERLGAGSPFPAADDNDLGFRLLEAGYRIVYAPEAVVYHRAWRPKGDYLRMRWNYGCGKGGFYTKHGSLRDRYMVRRMGRDIGQRFVLFPRRALYERYRACGDIVYVLGILYGTARWTLTRRRRRAVIHRAM